MLIQFWLHKKALPLTGRAFLAKGRLSFVFFGGGGGNRTHVRRYTRSDRYMLSRFSISHVAAAETDKYTAIASRELSRCPGSGIQDSQPVLSSPGAVPRAGTIHRTWLPLFRRPEPSYRWQLLVFPIFLRGLGPRHAVRSGLYPRRNRVAPVVFD